MTSPGEGGSSRNVAYSYKDVCYEMLRAFRKGAGYSRDGVIISRLTWRRINHGRIGR